MSETVLNDAEKVLNEIESSLAKDARIPDDSPALPVAFPTLFAKDFAKVPAKGIINIANKANFQFWENINDTKAIVVKLSFMIFKTPVLTKF